MTRLNTDNAASLFAIDASASDAPTYRTAMEPGPFDDFLQRAGRSSDAAPKNGSPSVEEGDPSDDQAESEGRDDLNGAEGRCETGEHPEASRGDEPESAETRSDGQTGEDSGAAEDDGLREDPHLGGQAVSAAVDEGTPDEDALPGDADLSRGSSAKHENESPQGVGKSDVGRNKPQEVGPEVEAEEKETAPAQNQSEDHEAIKDTRAASEPMASGKETAAAPEAPSKENASVQSAVGDFPGAVELAREREPSADDSRRRHQRRDSRPAKGKDARTAGRTVADMPADPKTATVEEPANLRQIISAADEARPEAAGKVTGTAEAAEIKAASAAPPKGWSPEGLRSTTAPAAAEGAQPDQIDRVRFVQRVARAFEALGERNGSVRLRLRPPELGAMRLEVSVRNGMMTAHIETETSAARTVLLDNLPALRERLAQQNIEVDSFDVDLADGSPDGSPRRPGDERQPHDRLEERDAPTQETEEGETIEPVAVEEIVRTAEGTRLNVVI